MGTGNYIETYPIVNEKDEIISQCDDKELLHNAGHKHRGVHVFIERPKTTDIPTGFVLQHKSVGTENGGTWSSAVSGHVRINETYKKAAIREMYEELGIVAYEEELEEITYLAACEESGQEFVKLYLYLLDKNDKLRPNPNEVDGLLISPLEHIEENIEKDKTQFSPVFILLLNIFLTLTKRNWSSHDDN